MIREYTPADIQGMLDRLPVPQDYTDWVNTVIDSYVLGKGDNHVADIVEAWSSRGAKYQPGEVLKRWPSLSVEGGRTGGGLVQKAIQAGWTPHGGTALTGQAPKAPPSPRGQVEPAPAPLPPLFSGYRNAERTLYGGMDHAAQRRAFLSALFAPGEYVNIAWDGIGPDEKGKYRPAADLSTEKVGDILNGTGSDVLHHEGYNKNCGVWIRVNPVCEHPQGKGGGGVADTDITAFRYALIESDDMPEGAQVEAFDRLRLPLAALVLSGGKSVHAVVKIDAADREEYRQRVERLHSFCKSYGIPVDPANKNPSRFMRLPGVTRGNREQILLDVGGGCGSWDEFEEFIEDVADGLPPTVALENMTGDHLPPKRPELIKSVLRRGHIMMLSGGSKSGKSFLLIELALAVAGGGAWLGRQCTKGRALYINMELDEPSMAHRFQAIEDAAKIQPGNIAGNLETWTLRGTSATLLQIVKSIERKARKRTTYDIVIIDPLYKVLGKLDENSAGDVGQLFAMFDRIAAVTGAAVVFCHHHSKGGQAGKSALDRASGSGVFARSPDALLDCLELEATNDAIIRAGFSLSGVRPVGLSYSWTLREFAPVDDETGFFAYPLHVPDVHNALRDARTAKEAAAADARRRNLNKSVYWFDIIRDCFNELADADVSGAGIVGADALIQAVMYRAGTDSLEHTEKKIREAGYIFRRAIPSAGKPRTVERKPEKNDAE